MVRCYSDHVRAEQRIIAEWMRRQLDRLGWSGKEWAEKAGVNPSTVTRAMEDDYKSVTSMPTIDALARAAGTVSPLAFMEHNGHGRGDVPSDDALAIILAKILPEDPRSPRLPLLARRLGYGLAILARNPELARNPDMLQGVAESVAELPPPPEMPQ